MKLKGVPSGDMECFCFDVTEEEFKRVMGKKAHKEELKERIALNEFYKDIGKPLTNQKWRIYPRDILELLGVEGDGSEITLNITLEV